MRRAVAAAFVGGSAAMLLEVAALRAVAPMVGASLYASTSVIGAVLAGLALGSWLGGRLADRLPPRPVLAGALVAGALLALAALPLAVWRPTPAEVGSAGVVAMVAWLALSLFLLPSVALGAVAPAAGRLAVRDLATAGRDLGLVSAATTLGGLTGTFAAGLLLVDAVGARGTIGLAALLAGSGALAVVGPTRWLLPAGLAVAVPLASAYQGRAALAGPCTWESAYHCIAIDERPSGDGRLRVLVLDRLVHGFAAPDDPLRLEYGYIRTFAALTAAHVGGRPDVRALFLGGGAYTLPRYLEARYPGASVEVIEIDPKVTRAAETFLGLRSDTRVRSFNQDARQFFLEREPVGAYDLVYGDAFDDLSIPYHLTTREFAALVRRALRPDGLYLANVIDLYPRGDFLVAYLATLATELPHVALVAEARDPEQERLGGGQATYVVVASMEPVSLEALRGVAGVGAPVDPATLRALIAQGEPHVLTDDHAPVDRLTEPLFLSRRL